MELTPSIEQTLSTIRKPYPGMFGLQPKRGCTGIPLPGIEGRIRRADGSEADYDEPGELWIRAGNVALGYYGNEKATRETFVNGWLRTGDHFKIDRDGFLLSVFYIPFCSTWPSSTDRRYVYQSTALSIA